jgi:hypothetical protein
MKQTLMGKKTRQAAATKAAMTASARPTGRVCSSR